MRRGQRVCGPGEDRVDRARADARPEQLFGKLDHVAAGDAVAHRQRDKRRLQARAEGALRDLLGKPGSRAPSAPRTAHALGTVLGHRDRQRRQLFDLVARRLAHRLTLIL